jgi:hypothetical protein
MHQSGLHEREQISLNDIGAERPAQSRELWNGLISGLIGGLAATFVMTQYQVNSTKLINRLRHEQPQQGGSESTTAVVADKITEAIAGSRIPPERRNLAGNLVHYGFGTLMGATYGVLNEVLPATNAGRGLAYGAALWAAADEVALPATGLAKWWPEYPIHVHANALGAHLAYAATLDGLRRAVRSLLESQRKEEAETAHFRQPHETSRKYGRVPARRFNRFGTKGEQQAA